MFDEQRRRRNTYGPSLRGSSSSRRRRNRPQTDPDGFENVEKSSDDDASSAPEPSPFLKKDEKLEVICNHVSFQDTGLHLVWDSSSRRFLQSFSNWISRIIMILEPFFGAAIGLRKGSAKQEGARRSH